MTWSHTNNAAYKTPSAVSRKQFAKMIETACRRLSTEVENIAVFQEMRKNGQPRYRSLVAFPEKAGGVWQIDEKMFEMHHAKTFTEVDTQERPFLRRRAKKIQFRGIFH